MNDTKPDLDAIEARANAATPGPWEQRQNAPMMSGAVWSLRVKGQPGIKASVTEYQHGHGNAEFIAHAREDVPALVAYARTLEIENERLEVLLRTMDHWAEVAETVERKANEAHARREAAEAERDHLTQRLDQVRALAPELAWFGDFQPVGFAVPVVRKSDLDRVLDGDQRTEEA